MTPEEIIRSSVREFVHRHDEGVCAPDCYGCFLVSEGLRALAAERAALMEYINLLGDECNDHAMFMASRFQNWKSPRYEEGVRLRKKLGIPDRSER